MFVESLAKERRFMNEFAELVLHAIAYAVALFFGSVAGFLCFDKD